MERKRLYKVLDKGMISPYQGFKFEFGKDYHCKDFDGDVFFPDIDFREWEQLACENLPFDEQLGFSYSYATYRKKPIF